MGNLVQRHNVPISKFVRITFCLVLGISLLKMGSTIRVEDFQNDSWSQNDYIKGRMSDVNDTYEVSFVFDILSRSAEGIAKYLSYAGDYIFGKGSDSYLKTPYMFTKAIMLAGAATLDDPKLQSMTNTYTNNCLKKVLPDLSDYNEKSTFLDRMFRRDLWIDQQLGKINLSEGEAGAVYTCKDLKDELREGLYAYADSKKLYMPEDSFQPQETQIARNMNVSSMLVNHYRSQREGLMGIQEGSKIAGGAGTAFQFLGRVFSWDGFVSIFSFGRATNVHGAAEAASRAKEFSELLTRAPHLKGMLMMILIGLFPWLIFFVVYGNWRILVWWFWVYFSICLWTPIWAIMYHIMQNVAFSADALSSFQPQSDGISLYASQVVLDRIYYLYSVYSMIQIAVPVFTTGIALYLARPMLSGFQEEKKPEFIDGSLSAASTGIGLANGGAGLAAKGATGGVL